MMLVIFVAFLMCFLPLMVVNVFDDKTKYPALHIFSSVMAWSSAVINPLIYAGGSSQYRIAYKSLFWQLKTWKSSNSYNNNNNKVQVSKSNIAGPSSEHNVKATGECCKINSTCLEEA